MTNPYQPPAAASVGPSGILETTPEGWLQYHGTRTKEDWVALFEHFALRGPQTPAYRLRRLAIPLLILLAGAVWSGFTRSLPIATLAITLAVFVWFRYPAMVKSSMRTSAEKMMAAGRNLTLLGDQWITLTPTSFQIRTPYSWSGIDWQAIEKVEQTADYLFVFFSPNSAVPIRLRDFPDDGSRQRFVDRAFEYFQAGRMGAFAADVVRP